MDLFSNDEFNDSSEAKTIQYDLPYLQGQQSTKIGAVSAPEMRITGFNS